MIDKVSKKLLFSYYLVFVFLVLVSFAGFFLAGKEIINNMSDNGIFLQTISILSVMICVPLGLKLHAVKVKQLQGSEEEKLSGYLYWSNIRLLLVAIPLLLNVLLYYLTQHNSMLFCAGIPAILLVFCKPLKYRMVKELNLEPEETEAELVETEKTEVKPDNEETI